MCCTLHCIWICQTDNGFRLFKNFGKREENDSTQGPEVPERSQNWLFFVYDLMMGKKKESELGNLFYLIYELS